MKVDHSISGNEAGAARQNSRTNSTREAKETKHSDRSRGSSSVEGDKGSVGGAKTEISSKARDMATAKNIAAEAPDVREDRVADLKRRISEGSYRVNEDAIADRLVEDHMRMGGL